MTQTYFVSTTGGFKGLTHAQTVAAARLDVLLEYDRLLNRRGSQTSIGDLE